MDKKILLVVVIIFIGLALMVFGAFSVFYKTATPATNNVSNMVSDLVSNITKTQLEKLKMEVIKEGKGAEAKMNDRVIVKYVGMLENGAKLDSNMNNSDPFTFVLGENKVIKGWELGVLGMKVGERRRLTIPPELAYGQNGRPPFISANATLVFDVDLMGILIK